MPLIIFLLAISFFSMHLVLEKKRCSPKHKIQLLLLYLVAFLIGVQGAITSIAHLFYPIQTASLIGWTENIAFQFEIGIANLAFSILAFVALYFRKGFLLAVIIGYSVLLWGSAIGHVIQYAKNKDNLGMYFISDIVSPCILILTFFLFILSEPKATTLKGKARRILDLNKKE